MLAGPIAGGVRRTPDDPSPVQVRAEPADVNLLGYPQDFLPDWD